MGDNFASIAAFELSFVVIARLWLAHHATLEHVGSYSQVFLLLNLFWAFTVVLLPLPTEMISQLRTSPASVGIYIGTMAASSLALTAMTLLIRQQGQLQADRNPIEDRRVFSSVVMTLGFFVALIVGVLVPSINLYALLILLLTTPLQWLYNRRTVSTRPGERASAG